MAYAESQPTEKEKPGEGGKKVEDGFFYRLVYQQAWFLMLGG